MDRTSHVVPIYLLALVQCFAMAATVMAVETQVEVFSKESDLVVPDSPRNSNSLRSPYLRCFKTEWFQESI